jgi:hypothetical protein
LEESVSLDEGTESRYLSSNGSSHFGLGVFEELDESGYKIAADNLVVDSLGNLQIR